MEIENIKRDYPNFKIFEDNSNNFKILITNFEIIVLTLIDLKNILFFLTNKGECSKIQNPSVSINCTYKNNNIKLFENSSVYESYNVKFNFLFFERDMNIEEKVSFMLSNDITYILYFDGRIKINGIVNTTGVKIILKTGKNDIQFLDQGICKIYNYVSINNLCGDIIVLNLKDKDSQFDTVSKLLQSENLNCARLESINGNDCKYNNLWNEYIKRPKTAYEIKIGRKAIQSRGALGYLLTMKQIFEDSILQKRKYICIVDDDIGLAKDFFISSSVSLQQLSNFNILKFGSSQWKWEHKILNKYYKSNKQSNGSFFNIYNFRTYKNILNEINKFYEPFDCAPLRQFINDRSYVHYPNIAIANLDHISSISLKKRTKDYIKFKWDKNLFKFN
jgi:hypothetical protein